MIYMRAFHSYSICRLSNGSGAGPGGAIVENPTKVDANVQLRR